NSTAISSGVRESGGAGLADGLHDHLRVISELLVDEPIWPIAVILRLSVSPPVLGHLVDSGVPTAAVGLDEDQGVVVQGIGPAFPFRSPWQVDLEQGLGQTSRTEDGNQPALEPALRRDVAGPSLGEDAAELLHPPLARPAQLIEERLQDLEAALACDVGVLGG